MIYIRNEKDFVLEIMEAYGNIKIFYWNPFGEENWKEYWMYECVWSIFSHMTRDYILVIPLNLKRKFTNIIDIMKILDVYKISYCHLFFFFYNIYLT